MIATVIERAAGAVASASLRSFLIFAVAGLIIALWRSSSASSRHFVWTAAIAASLALPVLGVLLPQWRWSALAIQIPRAASITVLPRSEAGAVVQQPASIPIRQRGSGSKSESRIESSSTTLDAADIGAGPAEVATLTSMRSPVAREVQASEPARNSTSTSARTSVSWATLSNGLRQLGWQRIASLVWLGGFGMVLLPFCIGRLKLRRIALSARVVRAGRWATLLDEARVSGGIARPVTLLESAEAAMPMTWGVLTPVLLLPAYAEEWPAWKCRNILLHELAHVERRDCLTQLVARVACAIYWFNPLAWVAAQRMQVERELACDDRVLGNGSRPSDYAGHLLDVARSLRPARATAHAAIAMARPSQLSGRLTAVLDRTRNRQRVSPRFRAAVAATMLGVSLPIASFTPWVGEAAAATTASRATGNSESAPVVGPTSFSTSPTSAEVAEHLPPVAISGRFAGGVSRLQDALGSLGGHTALTASIGGIFPIIKAVQSSDGALGLAVSTAPVAAQSASCWESQKDRSTSVNISDDDSRQRRTTVRFSSGDCILELRADGQFTLRPDLSDVASMDRDGSFTVEERDGRTSRRMEIRSGASGLEHIYYVNGRREDYSADARAWLANILLAVERRTAFAASTRVAQIFAARGAKGVLDEVSLMPSDYAKSAYLSVLLKQDYNLDGPTLTRIVQQSTREMTSDYYLAEVIGKVGTQRNADEGTWRAFADASTGMKSDYYKSQVISKVLSRDRLDAQTIATLLKAASTINSDYYQAETLKSMSKKYAITPQTRPYYLAALERIGSDYYKAEVLSFVNSGEALDASTTGAILKAISGMGSDYYKSEALGTIAKRGRLDASSRAEYFAAIRSIDSDYYKHQALNTSLAERPLTHETVAAILSIAPALKSDYELSGLLTSIAQSYPIDDSLRPAFQRAVDSIESDYYRGAVLNAARRSTAR